MPKNIAYAIKQRSSMFFEDYVLSSYLGARRKFIHLGIKHIYETRNNTHSSLLIKNQIS